MYMFTVKRKAKSEIDGIHIDVLMQRKKKKQRSIEQKQKCTDALRGEEIKKKRTW